MVGGAFCTRPGGNAAFGAPGTAVGAVGAAVAPPGAAGAPGGGPPVRPAGGSVVGAPAAGGVAGVAPGAVGAPAPGATGGGAPGRPGGVVGAPALGGAPGRGGASSCCRRVAVAARRPAVLPELAWSWELVPLCRAPVACHPPAGAAARATASPSGMKAAAEEAGVALSAQPVASAPWVQRPVEAAVAASDAKVRPQVAAEGQPVASARQPGVAEEGRRCRARRRSCRRWRRGRARRWCSRGRRRRRCGTGRRSCGRRGWRRSRWTLRCCGRRSAGPLRWRAVLLRAGRATFFPGLRHDERRGLRLRSGGRELRCRQGSCGEQQDAKLCHDVLGPRKNKARQQRMALTGMSVGRLNG